MPFIAHDRYFVEFPYRGAAPGAKGAGEIPMDGLAPATSNAVMQAAGVRITEIPITPEFIFEALTRISHKAVDEAS